MRPEPDRPTTRSWGLPLGDAGCMVRGRESKSGNTRLNITRDADPLFHSKDRANKWGGDRCRRRLGTPPSPRVLPRATCTPPDQGCIPRCDRTRRSANAQRKRKQRGARAETRRQRVNNPAPRGEATYPPRGGLQHYAQQAGRTPRVGTRRARPNSPDQHLSFMKRMTLRL